MSSSHSYLTAACPLGRLTTWSACWITWSIASATATAQPTSEKHARSLLSFPRKTTSFASTFRFFSSSRRPTSYIGDWSSDVCSSDLVLAAARADLALVASHPQRSRSRRGRALEVGRALSGEPLGRLDAHAARLVAARVRHGWQERSEERRVGKECGSQCARRQGKEN